MKNTITQERKPKLQTENTKCIWYWIHQVTPGTTDIYEKNDYNCIRTHGSP